MNTRYKLKHTRNHDKSPKNNVRNDITILQFRHVVISIFVHLNLRSVKLRKLTWSLVFKMNPTFKSCYNFFKYKKNKIYNGLITMVYS